MLGELENQGIVAKGCTFQSVSSKGPEALQQMIWENARGSRNDVRMLLNRAIWSIRTKNSLGS